MKRVRHEGGGSVGVLVIILDVSMCEGGKKQARAHIKDDEAAIAQPQCEGNE